MEQTKQGFFSKMVKYFKEVKSEMKKVVWPTFDKVKKNTFIVIVYVLLVGIVIWGLDGLFTWLISLVVNR